MVGGTVVQVVRSSKCRVEVLDTTYFDRCWRVVDRVDIQVGDSLWWQSKRGYLSRGDEFADRHIGPCKPCDNPSSEKVAP